MHYYIMPGLKRDFIKGNPVRPGPKTLPDIPKRDMEEIIKLVLRARNIEEEKILTKSRRRECVYARQLCMYLSYKYSRLTLKTVGERFGGKDHTTVIHANHTISNLIDTDPIIKQEVMELQDLILQ